MAHQAADAGRAGQTGSTPRVVPVYSPSVTPEPSAGRPLRIGVAGLGAVAQAVHLPLLARRPDRFEIAAVADLSPSLRNAIGDRHRVAPDARFDSATALLDAGGVDGLILLTSGSHGGDALAARQRGVPAP